MVNEFRGGGECIVVGSIVRSWAAVERVEDGTRNRYNKKVPAQTVFKKLLGLFEYLK